MKVALVDIDIGRWNPGLYVKSTVLEPYSIECLGAVLTEEGIGVILLPFDGGTPQEIAQSILAHVPNVVGFSVLTRNFNISRAVAQEIKTFSPDILIIFGGSHPSSVPEIVKFKEIDIVVIGEGERTLLDIVKAFKKGETFDTIKGIAYWNDGLQITPPRPRIEKLNTLPWPIRIKKWLEKSKVALPVYPTQSEQRSVAQIAYSRGCPFSCAFCCSPHLWRQKVFWRSAKEVVKEADYLKNVFDVNLLCFTDLTFNLLPSRVYELCKRYMKQKIEVNWSVDCRFLENTPLDLFETMAKAGCSRIAWGLESISDMTLSRIKKQQTLELASTLLEASNRAGIVNRVFIIIGFPWETKEELTKIPDVLKSLPIDSLRIAFPTPFPGTSLWNQFKGSLIGENFDHFTTDEPTIPVVKMQNEDLIEMRRMIFRKFYNSVEYEYHWKNKVRKFPHLRKPFDEFFEFLYKYEVLENSRHPFLSSKSTFELI